MVSIVSSSLLSKSTSTSTSATTTTITRGEGRNRGKSNNHHHPISIFVDDDFGASNYSCQFLILEETISDVRL